MATMAMKMHIRASATPNTNLHPPPSLSSIVRAGAFSNTHWRPASVALSTSSSISLLTLFSLPFEARALNKEQIVSSITEVEKTIDAAQEVGSSILDSTQRIVESVGSALKPGVDTALPIVQRAGEEALKVASPAISEASKKAQEAIQSTGIDTEPVLSAAKVAAQQTGKVIEVAKPVASSTFKTIITTDPLVLAEVAGALFLAYLFFPPIWSVIASNLRGFKGELTPAQALDLVLTKNHLLIDIRSEKDKEKAGIPRLPSSVKNSMIAIPLEELPSKLKGAVRNSKKVEAEIGAIKISYLKKINKGYDIIILDSYSDLAKTVAKALTSLGFKNTWIVADGFSGRKGWLQSRLGTDIFNFSVAELISPSQVIPASTRRFSTRSLTARSGQKLLPGGD